jgi:hypothetical protein
MRSKKDAYLPGLRVHSDVDANGKQSSEVRGLMKKFPTSAFVAGRLHEVGWGSDYGQSLLNHFREELLQECGKELSEVLERFRAFKPSSR